MKDESEEKRKFCGNCGSHNAYHYPEQVFCTMRFLKNKEPIVETLWHCEDWHLNSQGCRCIEDATRKGKK
jgi:hypothetical protein